LAQSQGFPERSTIDVSGIHRHEPTYAERSLDQD
jgi:hypothetical protein